MTQPPRVLVVDNDDNILRAFRRFLKKEECLMEAASSAEEALTKLKRSSYDLVITDVRMSGQSGVTFCLHIKHKHPDLPVIVITGYPDLISETEVKKLGADYFFLKPLELDKLRKAIRECLHLNDTQTNTAVRHVPPLHRRLP
ncbi:MAG: response regulator [Bacteroidota bacterium]